MNNKKLLVVGFILLALVQLLVPAQMIFSREDTLANGKEYRFQTRPIDPYDPFRGKYVTLSFSAREVNPSSEHMWSKGQTAYGLIELDENKYAIISNILPEPPTDGTPFLKTTVGWTSLSKEDKQLVNLHFPFDRYYMEESKAKDAERLHRRGAWNRDVETYAQVMIDEDGDAVLKDVFIDGIPLKEAVKKHWEESDNPEVNKRMSVVAEIDSTILRMKGNWIHQDDCRANVRIQGVNWTDQYRGVSRSTYDLYKIETLDSLPQFVSPEVSGDFFMIHNEEDTLHYEMLGLSDSIMSMMHYPSMHIHVYQNELFLE